MLTSWIEHRHILLEHVELGNMAHQPTNICDDLQPRLAAYALGEQAADAELLTHLATCSDCQRDLRAYAQVARVLPYSTPEVAPSPELRTRILAAATPPAPVPLAQPKRRLFQHPRWSWSTTAAFGLACAALLMLFWNLSLQSQLNKRMEQMAAGRENWQALSQLLNNPDVRSFTVAGDAGQGRLWAAPQSDIACLVIDRLPPLAAGQVYQVWLMQDDTPVDVGTFDSQIEHAWLMIRADQPLARYQALGVTIEPRGGSPTPTGPVVLTGPLTTPTAAAPFHQIQHVLVRLVMLS